jgi:hypothetical protein
MSTTLKNIKVTPSIRQSFAKVGQSVDFVLMEISADSPMESMNYLKSQLIIKNISKKNVYPFLKINIAVMALDAILNMRRENYQNSVDHFMDLN